MEGVYTATGKQKYWGKVKWEEVFERYYGMKKRSTKNVREVFKKWKTDLQRANYEDVGQRKMIQYGY
ncbi:hypothetical protein CW304_13365 [Bacillus sp. UFRGS-B20]|nr:hypothetical protein CW304_13365 [Bacillus sp. UFRGS-B20]